MKYVLRYIKEDGSTHEVEVSHFSAWREDVGFGGDGWWPNYPKEEIQLSKDSGYQHDVKGTVFVTVKRLGTF
jgi:hypothetical protein